MVTVCQGPWLARSGSLRLPVWLRLGRDRALLTSGVPQTTDAECITTTLKRATGGTQLGTLAMLPLLRTNVALFGSEHEVAGGLSKCEGVLRGLAEPAPDSLLSPEKSLLNPQGCSTMRYRKNFRILTILTAFFINPSPGMSDRDRKARSRPSFRRLLDVRKEAHHVVSSRLGTTGEFLGTDLQPDRAPGTLLAKRRRRGDPRPERVRTAARRSAAAAHPARTDQVRPANPLAAPPWPGTARLRPRISRTG